MTNNARHALVWLLTVHSAARTSSRTHHRNPGLDIRAIFEEGRENAKLVDCLFLEETVSVFITTACCALVFEPRSDDMIYRLLAKYSLGPAWAGS